MKAEMKFAYIYLLKNCKVAQPSTLSPKLVDTPVKKWQIKSLSKVKITNMFKFLDSLGKAL